MRRAVLSQFGIRGGCRRLTLPALGVLLLATAGIRPIFGQQASDAAVEAPVPPAHARYRLAYRFSPGQQVAYESVHTMKLTTQKGQIVETARNEARTSKHFEVVSVGTDGSVFAWGRGTPRLESRRAPTLLGRAACCAEGARVAFG